jgi:hypothetical protein
MGAMLKRYLRYVDRRLAAAVVLLVLIAAGLDRTWASSVENRLVTKQAAVDEAVKDLADFRTRLTEIRSDGVNGASALLERVNRLESLLPKTVDDLAITRLIVAATESTGVTLEQIKLVESGSREDVIGELKGVRFEFATTGSYAASANFLTTLVTSRQFIATFDKIEITTVAPGEDATIFTGDVSIKGELILWTLREEPISDPKAIEAPLTPTTTTPATTVPGPQTEEPADTGAASTTVPAPTTTTP